MLDFRQCDIIDHETGLSFDRPLPRTLVHKSAVSEVFLTDVAQLGSGRFAVAAQWPRDHVMFRPSAPGTLDPLLLVETVRQSAIGVSHLYYDVPANHAFVLTELDFDIDGAATRPAGDEPPAVFIDLTCTHNSPRPGRLDMTMEAVVSVDHRRRARVGLRWRAVDREQYARMRWRGASPSAAAPLPPTDAAMVYESEAISPETVGRPNARDVVLAPLTDGDWRLRLDPGHPVLFDHSCDHVPGMALLEAFRQAGSITGGHGARMPYGAKVRFTAFGEPDAPVTISAGRPDGGIQRVTAVQDGVTLAEATLRSGTC
ncbi:ScbA/BarX family gamma-butyrolactone biosynthesis protein [Streptomyces sp. NPDC053048]|uniref:ScbA/BarX family gamma-butyrolactone biosynthesis protein n=1 Tax=Streptomyces sp. NPDC053048 TaxID=3365694 RepID=UPI0037CFDB91